MIILDTKETEIDSTIAITTRTKDIDVLKLRPNNPNYIIIHSTNSYPTFDDLKNRHLNMDFFGVGYHFFISSKNRVFQARPTELEGAHCLGFNMNSLGICLYSHEKDNPTKRIDLTKKLIQDLKSHYGQIPVISHTYAQIEYINRILKQSENPIQFQLDPQICNPKRFQEISDKVGELIGRLNSESNEKLKNQLKKLKNCPGAIFSNFL